MVKKAGSWFQFNDEKIGQGADGARQFLKENPEITKKIIEAIKKSVV